MERCKDEPFPTGPPMHESCFHGRCPHPHYCLSFSTFGVSTVPSIWFLLKATLQFGSLARSLALVGAALPGRSASLSLPLAADAGVGSLAILNPLTLGLRFPFILRKAVATAMTVQPAPGRLEYLRCAEHDAFQIVRHSVLRIL